MQTSTKASLKSIKLRQPKKQSTWKQVKEIVLNPYETGKINYTEEENYEAYKVFSIMDVDNSGCITIRELQRLLMGQFVKTMLMSFDHPDTGIVWGLDKDNNVVIQEIEKDSPASKKFDIIPNFKLKSVNGVLITPENKSGLKELHKELIRSGHGQVNFEFYEPFYLISKFTISLDVEVDDRVFSATLPIGAVNDLKEFEEQVQRALREVHPKLGRIKVKCDPKSRQVTFSCQDYPFRLLFATGPFYQTSCRYAIGFWAEDFPYSNVHIGQPLAIDLKMKLKEYEMDILLNELFNTFDTDESGEFRFEEFRNFYVQFLSSEEKLQKMKDFAEFRFRDLEEEKRMLSIMQARLDKSNRRKLLKEKNHDKIIIHMKKVKEESRIGEDGVKRRVFKHKREDQVTMRHKKKNRGVNAGIVKFGLHKYDTEGVKEEPSVDEISLTKQRTMDIKKKQEINRKLRLNSAFQDQDKGKRDQKAAIMDAKKRFVRLHMNEVVAAFRACQDDTDTRIETVVNEKGLVTFASNISKHIQSPQLRFIDSLGVPDIEDIEMEELPATKLHPAAISYFFIKKRPGDDYNPRKLHPAFFGADFERESSKASTVALGAARMMMKDMNAEVKKKKLRNKSDRSGTLGSLSRLNGADSWDFIKDTTNPIKTLASQVQGEGRVRVVEEISSEVVNAVISWGVTLVVLNQLRETINSVLMKQLSSAQAIDEQFKDSSSALAMLEKVAITGKMFDALGRLVRPNADPNHDSSMDAIHKLFEQHAEMRQQKEVEKAQKLNARRVGRFGPDEVFLKEEFDNNAHDDASGRSAASWFGKRTVNAGFFLEKQVVQSMTKRRFACGDLNARPDSADGDIEHLSDPGGVNTQNPLSVMVLNQLTFRGSAYHAHAQTYLRSETAPASIESRGRTEPTETWEVIGPAMGLDLGSASLNESGGSSVTVVWKPNAVNNMKFSTFAADPKSAISEEASLDGPLKIGRPATAYGLDKSIYESGQGKRYIGFVRVPIALTTEEPLVFELLN